MGYPTIPYRRYCSHCIRQGKRVTWIGYSEWLAAGEPR